MTMRNANTCRAAAGSSSWLILLPKSRLHAMIGAILLIMNSRVFFMLYPDDVHLETTTSRKTSDAYHDYPKGVSHPFRSSATSIDSLSRQKQYASKALDDSSLQLQPTKNETIIVGLANKAYADVAILWYRRMTEAGFTNHRILAVDEPTAWVCEELELRYDVLSKFTRPIAPSCSPDKFQDDWRRKTYLFAARWIYVRQKLLEGYHVLLSDVDAVYNYNAPISKLEQGEYDHYTAYADKMPPHIFQQTGFTICGCFNWMRSTPSMVHFLDLFLSNCGCTKQGQGNSTSACKCGCDDQVTMNSMLFYQLDMEWERYRGAWSGEFFQDSLTGVSQRTGQRIKVLDRSFVFRGHHNNICPKGNWITFPKTNNKTETKLDQMKRLLGNCPRIGMNTTIVSSL